MPAVFARLSSNVLVLAQADIERMELVDLDQIDLDDEGPIEPSATGLGAEIRRNWEASIEEAVAHPAPGCNPAVCEHGSFKGTKADDHLDSD